LHDFHRFNKVAPIEADVTYANNLEPSRVKELQ